MRAYNSADVDERSAQRYFNAKIIHTCAHSRAFERASEKVPPHCKSRELCLSKRKTYGHFVRPPRNLLRRDVCKSGFRAVDVTSPFRGDAERVLALMYDTWRMTAVIHHLPKSQRISAATTRAELDGIPFSPILKK